MISGMTDHADPYGRAAASAARLRELAGTSFDAAVVLGSGWLAAADAIGTAGGEIPLAHPGGFPAPTPPGHRGARPHPTPRRKNRLLFPCPGHLLEGARHAAGL